MRRLPSEGPTVESYRITNKVDQKAMTVKYPDGTEYYNPTAPVEWRVEMTMSTGETLVHPISPYDAERYYQLRDIEFGPTNEGDAYIKRILRSAGFAFPEYEYDEDDV